MKTRISLLICIFLFTACGGTGAGNPTPSAYDGVASNGLPVPGAVPGSLIEPATSTVLRAICTVLVRCANDGLTEDTCESGVKSSSGFDSALGLPSGTYVDLAAIQAAEISGAIRPNNVAVVRCNEELSSLNCSASAVQGAYQSGAVHPFGLASGMVPNSDPTSCLSVFR